MILSGHDRVFLEPPLTYKQFVQRLADAYLILTDSGGVQEEAPSLGKPVLVLRNETERQEGIDAGTARLIGAERSVIVKAVDALLNDKEEYEKVACIANPYGDGQAARHIVQHVLKKFLPD